MNPKRLALKLGSRLWSQANRLVREARKVRGIEGQRLPCRVISVGNLQAGGTGKTPLVIEIARESVRRGLQICVLSRGYGSVWESRGGVIIPGEPGPDPEVCGDEVALIHAEVPEAWIGIGRDRVGQFEELVQLAETKTGRSFDLAILDDGLQHWKIERDLNVVAVTDTRFGEALFRETFDVLTPFDLVVLTKGESFPEGIPDGADRVAVEYTYPMNPEEFPAGGYRLVCGVGDPERTRATLVRAGFPIESMVSFPDHHPYHLFEIERILSECETAGIRVLLTGKDWVKWQRHGVARERVTVVEPRIRFRTGQEIWERRVWENV